MSEMNEPPIDEILQRLQQGLVLRKQRRLDQALEMAQAALALARQHLPYEHPYFFSAIINAADIYMDMKSFDVAERLVADYLGQVSGIGAAVFEIRDQCRSLLANLFVRTQRPDRAEPVLLESIRDSIASKGEYDPSLLPSYELLALVFLQTNRQDEARALLPKVVGIRDHLDAGHPEVAEIRSLLATTFKLLGAPAGGLPEPAPKTPEAPAPDEFSHEEAKCWHFFVDWDFASAASAALELLVSRSTARLLAIRLLSLLWTGRPIERDAEKTRAVAPGNSWIHAFVDFIVGRVPFEEVLARAETNDDLCQAYYYSGLFAWHNHDETEGRARLQKAVAMKSDLPEARRAAVELDSLAHRARDPAELDADQQRLLAEAYRAIALHDYPAFIELSMHQVKAHARTPQLVLLEIAAFRALDALDLVRSLVILARAALLRWPWHARIVAVLTESEPAQKLLPEAKNAVEICQLHYYAMLAMRIAGRWEEADAHRQKILELAAPCPEYDLARMDGADPAVVLRNVKTQLVLLYKKGAYEQAERIGRAALKFARQNGAAVQAELADVLIANAANLAERGSIAESFSLFEELERLPNLSADDSFYLALNLGQVHLNKGLLPQANRLLTRALQLSQSRETSPTELAALCNALGLLAQVTNDPKNGLDWFTKAEKVLDESKRKPDILRAALEDNMGLCLADLGRGDEALVRFEKGYALLNDWATARDPSIAPTHPSRRKNLLNLAWQLLQLGQTKRAAEVGKQAVDLCGSSDLHDDPMAANTFITFGMICAAIGSVPEAMDSLLRGIEKADAELGEIMALSTEELRLSYASEARFHMCLLLPLAAVHFSGDPTRLERVFDVVLRRKALAAEATLIVRDATSASQYPLLAPVLQELESVRAEIAEGTRALAQAENREAGEAQLRVLEDHACKLETRLAREIPELRLDRMLKEVSVRKVMESIPRQWSIIEFVRTPMLRLRAGFESLRQLLDGEHYFALVIPCGDLARIAVVDLGPTGVIDESVTRFRAALHCSGGNRSLGKDPEEQRTESTEEAGRKLKQLLFDPIAAILPSHGHIVVAPDGALVRLPFETLPLAANEYLTDRYSVSYVGTCRDLLRLAVGPEEGSGRDVVLAAPDFEMAQGRADTPSERRFEELSGTKREGEAIAQMLGVPPLLGADASKGKLKEASSSPRILHLATHGYFDETPEEPQADTDGLRALLGRPSAPQHRNPLLRTGLALAGANAGAAAAKSPKEIGDGLLSAAEVLNLKLGHTELVVLSACDTGLGALHTTEGVLGLRRAFHLAGARTVIVSLWKVPDEQTCELMIGFYRRLLKGMPRVEALRAAQRECREKDPSLFYWAAFVCFGDTGSLFGLAPTIRGDAQTNQSWMLEQQSAVAGLNRAIAAKPNHAPFYMARGIAFHNLGRLTDAVRDFDRAAELSPDLPLLHFSRGFAYHRLGQNDLALRDFDRAIALDPVDASAYHRRGNTLSALGDNKAALANLNRAIALSADDVDALYDRGGFFADQGMHYKAFADYSRVIMLRPSYQQAYVNRATVLLELGKISEAIQDLQTSLQLDPHDALAHVNLATAFFLKEDPRSALQALDRAQALGGSDMIRKAQEIKEQFWASAARQ